MNTNTRHRVYKQSVRSASGQRRLYRGRYRFEIWRVTGPKEDDVVTVDQVGTFGGPKVADKIAKRLTRKTGIEHIAAEYDALVVS